MVVPGEQEVTWVAEIFKWILPGATERRQSKNSAL
jgi:hypothetical protein